MRAHATFYGVGLGSRMFTCEECGRDPATLDEALRWGALLTAELEDELQAEGVAVYCPDCAGREFGDPT